MPTLAPPAVAALLATHGVPAVHANALGEEQAVTVIQAQSLDAAGLTDPWAKRQWTLTVAAALGAAPGDTFALGEEVWRVDGIVQDDGHLARLAVRREQG